MANRTSFIRTLDHDDWVLVLGNLDAAGPIENDLEHEQDQQPDFEMIEIPDPLNDQIVPVDENVLQGRPDVSNERPLQVSPQEPQDVVGDGTNAAQEVEGTDDEEPPPMSNDGAHNPSGEADPTDQSSAMDQSALDQLVIDQLAQISPVFRPIGQVATNNAMEASAAVIQNDPSRVMLILKRRSDNMIDRPNLKLPRIGGDRPPVPPPPAAQPNVTAPNNTNPTAQCDQVQRDQASQNQPQDKGHSLPSKLPSDQLMEVKILRKAVSCMRLY